MSIELTENAARRICSQIQERGKGLGLRLGVVRTGCSGYGYKLDYADELTPQDQVFEAHGARVVVAQEDLKLLDGLRVDFRRDGLNAVYKFENPNAAALCGCGESFTTEDPD